MEAHLIKKKLIRNATIEYVTPQKDFKRPLFKFLLESLNVLLGVLLYLLTILFS